MTFPNMAGLPDIDDELAAELEAAGIEVYRLHALKDSRSEVNTAVIGGLHGWTFKRAWYYWSASGPGIELAAAEKLHAMHGREVRVAGHCGCPSPREWYKGLAVGNYHVDTPRGLKALAETIVSLVTPSALEPSTVDIDAMVRRFLTWKLPSDFNPDAGISFTRDYNQGRSQHEPVGTNLFTFEQAKAMVLHMLSAE